MAQRVAEQPADEPLTIEKWELELDAGITVEADLSGSLARDLSYRFEVIGPRRRGARPLDARVRGPGHRLTPLIRLGGVLPVRYRSW